jgi:hypothetical protein
MAIESCDDSQTKIGNPNVCSPFEKIASRSVDSMFLHPFGCPAKYQKEGSIDCDGLSNCTIVHCPGECAAPEGFVAEVNDCEDVVYVRENEIGRPIRGDIFFFKGQRFRVDAVTGCCGYTWRCIITEDEESCATGTCTQGVFD